MKRFAVSHSTDIANVQRGVAAIAVSLDHGEIAKSKTSLNRSTRQCPVANVRWNDTTILGKVGG
jgi:hypothetical protein